VASEADLYQPVKEFLEAQDYEVKGEVRGCDVVGRRGDEPPVIVELKLRFSLPLVLQGVARLALSERVYLAVPRAAGRRGRGHSPDDRNVRKLCRMLGLGLMTVNLSARSAKAVEIVLDPLPYRPRPNKRAAALLLGEHARRTGDPNRGGVNGVKIVTAYRQEALRCAQLIERTGSSTARELRAAGFAPNAAKILQRDYYGWFRRERRGVYTLSENGRRALVTFAHALDLPVHEAAVMHAAE
jgi:hypothetical protein